MFSLTCRALEGQRSGGWGQGGVVGPTWLLLMSGSTWPLIMITAIRFTYDSTGAAFNTWLIVSLNFTHPAVHCVHQLVTSLPFESNPHFSQICLMKVSGFFAKQTSRMNPLDSLWFPAQSSLIFLSFILRDIILYPVRHVGVSCFCYCLIHSSCGSVYITLLEERPWWLAADGDLHSPVFLPHSRPTLTTGCSVYEAEQKLETSTTPSH